MIRAIVSVVMKPQDVDICAYHAFCPDGALSAAIFHVLFPAVLCVPIWCESLPTKVDFSKKNVVFMDITPTAAILAEVLATAKDVFVIDHHESARSILMSMLGPEKFLFSLTECGATLTWAWMHGAVPIPPFVSYVRALDLFDWSALLPGDPEAMDVSRAIECLVRPDFRAMASRLRDPDAVEKIRVQLPTVNTIVDSQIARALSSVEYFALRHEPRIRVAVINSQHFVNWIAHALYSTKDVNAVWVWYHHGKKEETRVMLRANGRFDCQAYANLFGGGGHEKAASFTCASYIDMMEHMWVSE